MRLRQLGTTQAVTFVAPPEVHYNILDVCKMDSHSALDSSHVVTWLLDQTCATNHALQPLYFAQGGDFCRRIQAEQTYKSFLTDVQHRKAFLQVLQQREQRTLEELYEPEASNVDAASSSSAFDGISMSGRIRVLIQTLKQNQLESPDIHRPLTNSALEEVEQEREVAYEVEEEREVERPILMTPLKFPGLHKSILNFAKTGLLEGSQGYLKASAALDCTQLAAKYRVTTASFLPHLYISDEFRKTVKLKPGEKNDTFTVSAVLTKLCTLLTK